MVSKMRTFLRLTAGFVLLIAGCLLALPGVPGPGIVLVLFGLALLSDHFEWARRSVVWIKKKASLLRHRIRHDRNGLKDGEQRAATNCAVPGGRV